MIVRLHLMQTATLTHETDPNIHVTARKVHEHDGVQWIRVQGKQIKVALRNKRHGEFYHDNSWYYFYNDPSVGKWEWSEVKHQHIVLSQTAKFYCPEADTTYVMRVQDFDKYGNVMVLPRDAIKARLIKRLSSPYISVLTGYVHLNLNAVRFV